MKGYGQIRESGKELYGGKIKRNVAERVVLDKIKKGLQFTLQTFVLKIGGYLLSHLAAVPSA
jgi:hypothetical protein